MISYKPLFKLMIDRDISRKQLVEGASVSWPTLAKMNKNEYVALEVLDRICKFLKCQPGEIIEYVEEKQSKIETQDSE